MKNNKPKIELMAFWLTINKVLADRGLEEIRWGEARRYWEIAREQQLRDEFDRISQIMNQKVA